MKLLTKIRVEFSDLRDQRYNHNFKCESPMCSCGLEDKTSVHYFLCCPRYHAQRNNFLSKISELMGSDVSVVPNDHLIHILIYGSNVFNIICNKLIIEQSILYIKKSGRFKKLEAFSLNENLSCHPPPPPSLSFNCDLYVFFCESGAGDCHTARLNKGIIGNHLPLNGSICTSLFYFFIFIKKKKNAIILICT